LVLFYDVDIKDLVRLNREYPWERPPYCPCCRGGLWWHGFVPAYFSLSPDAVFLRRLRCPQCGAVHRLRPRTHWRRFQTPIQTIREAIAHRVKTHRWRADLSHEGQRQWWRRLRRLVKTILGVSFPDSLLAGFDALLTRGFIPVSRSIQRAHPR
jgi:hypothetical protein